MQIRMANSAYLNWTAVSSGFTLCDKRYPLKYLDCLLGIVTIAELKEFQHFQLDHEKICSLNARDH